MLDVLGEASAKAQGLKNAITSGRLVAVKHSYVSVQFVQNLLTLAIGILDKSMPGQLSCCSASSKKMHQQCWNSFYGIWTLL